MRNMVVQEEGRRGCRVCRVQYDSSKDGDDNGEVKACQVPVSGSVRYLSDGRKLRRANRGWRENGVVKGRRCQFCAAPFTWAGLRYSTSIVPESYLKVTEATAKVKSNLGRVKVPYMTLV